MNKLICKYLLGIMNVCGEYYASTVTPNAEQVKEEKLKLKLTKTRLSL